MSQFLANRSMENFFINPTMTQDNSMETFARISIMSEPSPKVRFNNFPLSEGSKEEKVRPVSTIQDLFLTHNLLTNYHSEEESASPRDSSDSLSLGSEELEDVQQVETPQVEVGGEETREVEPSAIDLFLVPEELANSCTKIEHRWNRAQTVILKPVGKPRVVSLTKLVEIRPGQVKRSFVESLKSGTRQSSIRRAESKKSIRSTTSTRVSFDPAEPLPALPVSSPTSLLPTPMEDVQESDFPDPETPRREVSIPETPKRQPSRPLMQAASTFDAFPRLSDIAAGRPSLSIVRSMTVSGATDTSSDGSSSPMSPAKRRLHRIASSISNASDLVRRKSSISSIRKSVSPSTSSAAPRISLTLDKDSSHTPIIPIPQRRSSMGKLTPRGPTERAPILVLPPFPDDDDEEDDDFGDASSDQAMSKWDRPRALQAAKVGKARPSIDGIVAGSA